MEDHVDPDEAGEPLVTDASMRAAGLRDQGLERRRLELKGKSEATDVVVKIGGALLGSRAGEPAGVSRRRG